MNEARPSIEKPVDVVVRVLGFGADVARETVVVGSCAAHLALGAAFRGPGDIDLAVSEGAFRYLREHPDREWTESEFADGRPRLTGNGYDIGVGWGGWCSQADLAHRSWQASGTAGVVNVASLPDVYSWKQDRNLPQDQVDTRLIQDRLHNAALPLLPEQVLRHEIEACRGCLPVELQQAPEAQNAIYLAANGLHTVSTLYGDRRIGRANQIIGDLELPGYNVAATYHNGFDLVEDMRWLQLHLTNIGASDADRLDALIAQAGSDMSYGNGRRNDNERGYDELRSANLLEAHARMLDFGPRRAARLRDNVIATSFDERTKAQRGKTSDDLVSRALVGIDLHFAGPDAAFQALGLAVEDNMSARYSRQRILGRVAAAHGVRFSSTLEALTFTDEHPDARPDDVPDAPTILQAIAGHMSPRSSSFLHPATGNKPPHDWTLDNAEIRLAHAKILEEVGRRLLSVDPADRISCVAAYAILQQHTEAVRAQVAT